MFLSKKSNYTLNSNSTRTTSRNSEVMECLLTCEAKDLDKIIEQLTEYRNRSIPKQIIIDKLDKNESITKSLTPENFPSYFYNFSFEKTSSFFGFCISRYRIKISGTLESLQSAIEALVFANLYDEKSITSPPALIEYAKKLLSGDIPSVVRKADINF